MGMPAPPPSGPNRIVNVRALWAGGAASAVVAALVAVVGVIICEDVLDLEMTPPPLLPIGQSLVIQYALTSGVLALAATGLAHLLAMTTPRPAAFFSWIVGLATVVGIAVPLGSSGPWAARFATAIVDLAIGLCVLTLVRSMLARATQRVLPGPWRAPAEYGQITLPPDAE
jgi:Family of unknown function (DUF6069)